MTTRNEKGSQQRTESFQNETKKTTNNNFSHEHHKVNSLYIETLREMYKFFKSANEEKQRRALARRLDEIDHRRWGYPSFRIGRSRYAA